MIAEGFLTHAESSDMGEEELVDEYENFVAYVNAKNKAQREAMRKK